MNYFAIGFGAVALTAVGAIDYANQANAAGEAAGRFSAGAYVATYGARITGVREARADAAAAKVQASLRKAGARPYLPGAPAGWTRRAWLDGNNSAVLVPVADNMPENTPDLLKNMAAKSAKSAEERRDDETWVYQQGDRIIALRAKYTPRDDARNLAGVVADTLAATAFVPSTGWAVIGGVAFAETSAKLGDAGAPFISQAGTPFHAYEAPIGLHDAVQLSVLSNAGEDDLRAVLGAIDYNGLNALLSYPLVHIGLNAPDIPLEAQPQMADLMLKMHSDLRARRSVEAQAWLQRAATPENAMKMMMNELATGWGAGGIPQLDPGAASGSMQETDEPAQASASGDVPSSKSVVDFAASLFGGGEDPAEREPAPKPKRLMLSGGSSCLAGSAGKFCRD
ncbi:hypothetical protein [Roseovarius arcticus]|uniref:hypothetical protein n=1 Tax=Roseovarius arcticus TaxID=2547404 RepID=UPI001110D789|nr:hypothetical protein [Roseovarius arcticus]